MKRSLLVILCVALAVSTGCREDDNDQNADTQSDTNTVVNETNVNNNQDDSSASLKMLSDKVHGMSYATEDGYYYISNSTNSIGNDNYLKSIIYVDYKTAQEVYLCNNPNCQHKNEECTAVIPEELCEGETYIFGDGKSLYLVATPMDSAGSKSINLGGDSNADGAGLMLSSDSDQAPTIYRMNMDGTSREKFAEFGSGTTLENNFMGDGDTIYAVSKKIKSTTEGNSTTYETYDRKLVSIDNSGKISELYSLDNNAKILDCYNNGIVLEYIDYGNGLTEKDITDANYKQILSNAKCTIVKKNLADGHEDTIDQFVGASSYSLLIDNNIMYVEYDGDQSIYSYDMATGSKKTILTGKELYINNVVNNNLICNSKDYDTNTPYLYVNISDGTVTESKLHTRYNTPVAIITETKDKLYVSYDYENKSEYVAWVGINQEYIAKNYYGMISKEDYLAGKANYQQVQLIGMGY